MAYLLKLFRASFRVIRTEGVFGFFRLFWRWLRGERGLYHPDVKPKNLTYYQHRLNTEPIPDDYADQIKDWQSWDTRPRFDILTIATSDTPLKNTAYAIKQQTYTEWTYHIVGQQQDTLPTDKRILYSETIEQVAKKLIGDYVVMVEAGDQLAPYALYILAKAIRAHPHVDYFYSDTDILDKAGYRRNPFYKPKWSPETMLSVNLLAHVGVCRRAVWERLRQYQGWDFALRVGEVTQNIHHIPLVLYHRPQDAPKPGTPTADDLTAIAGYLRRTGLQNPTVTRDSYDKVMLHWDIPQPRKVSIIIPSRDQPAFVSKCLKTIFEQTTYPDYEVILVDTGSVEAETQAIYTQYADEARFTLVNYTAPFNFSKACNFGASHADGDLLLFLNNDTEILDGEWLYSMAQWFEHEGVGIVGPKLLYPDGRIQHAGVIIGLHGLAGHILALAEEHSWSIYGSDDWYRNFLAVTGACLMISRAVFDEVGQFEEKYRLNYSDIELCIAVIQAGYRVVYTPHVRLIHHESVTHKKQIPIEDTYLFNERLQAWLGQGDGFYNPNLTYQDQLPTYRRSRDDTPYNHNKTMMEAVRRGMAEQTGQN